ncbi:MAG: VOC family protein [Natronomonas sp.]
MKFTAIDHFVLTVEDVDATCRFYEDLGATVVTFGEGRKAIQFGGQKINVHPVDADVSIVADAPTPGCGDFFLVTDGPIDDLEEQLRALDVRVIEGPVERTGAVGPMTSVYVRDPDGNLVEIATYDDA